PCSGGRIRDGRSRGRERTRAQDRRPVSADRMGGRLVAPRRPRVGIRLARARPLRITSTVGSVFTSRSLSPCLPVTAPPYVRRRTNQEESSLVFNQKAARRRGGDDARRGAGGRGVWRQRKQRVGLARDDEGSRYGDDRAGRDHDQTT